MSDERHDTVADNVSAKHQFREVAKMIPHEEVTVAEMQQPLQPVTDCHGLNAAAMSEACANIADYAREATCYTENLHLLGYLYQIEEWAEAALAAPPRNCDRPECATTKAAQDTWRKENGGKTAYYEWLLATSTEGDKK